MTSLQSMIDGSPRMKALSDYLKADAHDSDRKWAEYVALAPDLAGFLNPKRDPAVVSSSSPTSALAISTTTSAAASVLAATSGCVPAAAPSDSPSATVQAALVSHDTELALTPPTTCPTICPWSDTGAAASTTCAIEPAFPPSTTCSAVCLGISTPMAPLPSLTCTTSSWNMKDVYPPLAALRQQLMTNAEWFAMSEWEQDLWEMKHLPEKERLASIDGIVRLKPEADKDRLRAELLAEVLRFGESPSALEPASAMTTSSAPASSAPDPAACEVHKGDGLPTTMSSTCSTLCLRAAPAACSIDIVLGARLFGLPPATRLAASVVDDVAVTDPDPPGNHDDVVPLLVMDVFSTVQAPLRPFVVRGLHIATTASCVSIFFSGNISVLPPAPVQSMPPRIEQQVMRIRSMAWPSFTGGHTFVHPARPGSISDLPGYGIISNCSVLSGMRYLDDVSFDTEEWQSDISSLQLSYSITGTSCEWHIAWSFPGEISILDISSMRHLSECSAAVVPSYESQYTCVPYFLSDCTIQCGSELHHMMIWRIACVPATQYNSWMFNVALQNIEVGSITDRYSQLLQWQLAWSFSMALLQFTLQNVVGDEYLALPWNFGQQSIDGPPYIITWFNCSVSLLFWQWPTSSTIIDRLNASSNLHVAEFYNKGVRFGFLAASPFVIDQCELLFACPGCLTFPWDPGQRTVTGCQKLLLQITPLRCPTYNGFSQSDTPNLGWLTVGLIHLGNSAPIPTCCVGLCTLDNNCSIFCRQAVQSKWTGLNSVRELVPLLCKLKFQHVQLSWDLGSLASTLTKQCAADNGKASSIQDGDLVQHIQKLWDPGGLKWFRLGGKPKFMGEGMLATLSLLQGGPALLGGSSQEGRRGRSYKGKGKDHERGGLDGRAGGFGLDWA